MAAAPAVVFLGLVADNAALDNTMLEQVEANLLVRGASDCLAGRPCISKE